MAKKAVKKPGSQNKVRKVTLDHGDRKVTLVLRDGHLVNPSKLPKKAAKAKPTTPKVDLGEAEAKLIARQRKPKKRATK